MQSVVKFNLAIVLSLCTTFMVYAEGVKFTDMLKNCTPFSDSGTVNMLETTVQSRKNIKYIIYLNDFSLPSNFYIYINGNYVDSLKNNSELFTGFTNNVDNLYFKWYWSYYSENIFFSSNFFINLKIIFERNF